MMYWSPNYKNNKCTKIYDNCITNIYDAMVPLTKFLANNTKSIG